MQTKNVYFSEKPDRVIVRTAGKRAVIDFPVNVTEIEENDRTEWLAETVYHYRTTATPNLEERVNANYEDWLKLAQEN